MKKFLLTALFVIALASTSFAFPELQLYIDGATYDAGSETWITDASSLDLYVISNMDLDNVLISIALDKTEFTEFDNPDGIASANIGGTYLNDWTWGDAPLATVDPDLPGDGDLAGHGIYPSWYAEFNAGNFRVADGGGIGDVQPDAFGDHFDPSAGYLDPQNANQLGEIKKFSVDLAGAFSFHFDAYSLNPDGSIAHFAPFSHDAGSTHTPEPATMLLFGLGLAGAGVYRKFKR